ncbi:MAG: sporulation initiation factor Spo0A C-terminal domain-containing protein [Eubacteriales bacterium]|nr:sporulation initiation factor Spo0A C-terminal domain-containing protein [Eubacteriales bacterium]
MAEERKRLRVLLAHAEQAFVKQVRLLLQTEERIELVGGVTDGDSATEQFLCCRPDLTILDTDLPRADGLTVAARIRSRDRDTGILLMSVFMGAQVSAESELLRIDYMMRKPVSPEALCEQIRLWAAGVKFRQEKSENVVFERRLSKILRVIGMRGNTKGFRCTFDMLCLTRDGKVGLTKVIYPDIAKKYNSTGENVERIIRYAIHNAWLNCSTEVLARYFGREYAEMDQISNGEFCSRLFQYLNETEDEN